MHISLEIMCIGRAYLGMLIVHCYLASYKYLALVLVFFTFTIFVTVTSEDVHCNIQKVKMNIRCVIHLFIVFATAACFLFLLKLMCIFFSKRRCSKIFEKKNNKKESNRDDLGSPSLDSINALYFIQ